MLVLSGCQKQRMKDKGAYDREMPASSGDVQEIEDVVDTSEVTASEEAEAEAALEAELEAILAASDEDLEAELIE